MGKFPVSEAKELALYERMSALGIREEDVQESFVRSGGRGGQNVNKVATCVHLRHAPTSTEVKCSRARTQGLNRYYARVLLADKVDSLIRGKESLEQMRIEKLRRQKRKRSKRSREKMLAEKHHVSHKKKLRGHVSEDEG